MPVRNREILAVSSRISHEPVGFNFSAHASQGSLSVTACQPKAKVNAELASSKMVVAAPTSPIVELDHERM